MVRAIIMLAMLCLLTYDTYGCDACGSSVTSNTMGILSTYRNNVVGLRYSYAPYSTGLEHGRNTKDYFHTATWSVQYQILKRWRASIQQAYQFNYRHNRSGAKQQQLGWSDMQLAVNYALINNRSIGEKGLLYAELGVGLKLPTGQYEDNLLAENLPDNFSAGRGNWGYLFQSNLVYTYDKMGIALGVNHQINSRSKDNYQFGNERSISLQFFMQQPLNEKCILTPLVGINYENVSHNTLANGIMLSNTGGQSYLASIGGHLRYGDCLLELTANQPLKQNYANEEVLAKLRWNTSLAFIF